MTRYFSAPGRVEICGNHTDHQCGKVLAAAIDLCITAVVEPNGTDVVRLNSLEQTYEIDLTDLSIRFDEKGRSEALVRGVAAWFARNGYRTGGFDAEISSEVPTGAGLSSSAAFEVLIGNIFSSLFGSDVSQTEIAIAGQFAENVYFGKPCGLMDQTISSFGGLCLIDFRRPQEPVVTPVRADFTGYTICVTITGDSHADLTPDYAAITMEMQAAAAHFNRESLRDVTTGEFFASIGKMRRLGDRTISRALHYFGENERVTKIATALENGHIKRFLELVTESGRSSLALLQNIYSVTNPHQQGLTLALALSEQILDGKGAWRVHGGGFAGTIIAFVPDELCEAYSKQMSAVFGEGCCHFLSIREKGGGEEMMK